MALHDAFAIEEAYRAGSLLKLDHPTVTKLIERGSAGILAAPEGPEASSSVRPAHHGTGSPEGRLPIEPQAEVP
jgi:hypothetical protein